MGKNKMSIFGIGPLLALLIMIYLVIMNFATKYIGDVILLEWIPNIVVYVISGLLLICGIPFLVASVITLLKEFSKDKLMTEGIYKIVRNPIYSSFICFIVPAFVILTKSLLIMSTPIFMYLVFKILIKKEENDLEQTFSQDYLKYKAKTNQIFPKFW